MSTDFFKQMQEDLFPHPDKFLDISTGHKFDSISDILKFRREYYEVQGRERGEMKVLRRGAGETDWS